jgi:hypothetical protein
MVKKQKDKSKKNLCALLTLWLGPRLRDAFVVKKESF